MVPSHQTHHIAMVSTLQETTRMKYCKYCNAEEEDSDEEQSEDEEFDGVISPNTSYSNGIHTSGDDTDEEDIINIPTSDDVTGKRN